MNKKRFLMLLNKKLRHLPKKEVEERILFYSEMIDDRIEEGLSEEEAVLQIGDINEIASQIISEVSLDYDINKKHSALQIILLIIGSPIWLSLVITFYVVVWSITITMWAIELPFIIFSFISKYLLIACKTVTKIVTKISKECFGKIVEAFKM